MQNFESFLQNLANGDVDPMPLVRRKKNGPPTQSLLPSQEAMHGIAEGAVSAMGSATPSAPVAPASALASQGGGKGVAMGAVGGALQGLQDALKPAPWQPVQTWGNQARESAIQSSLSQPPPMQMSSFNPYGMEEDQYSIGRGLAYGGVITPGGRARVGNEMVEVDEYGNAIVTPGDNPEADAETERQAALNAELAKQGVAERYVNIPRENAPPPMTVGDNEAVEVAQGYADREDTEQPVVPNQTGKPDTRRLVGDGTITPDELGTLYNDLQLARDVKPNKWKDFGFGALQGLNNALNHTNNPIQSYTDVKIARKTRPILEKIGAIEHQREFETGQLYKQTQMQNVRDDNDRQRADLIRKAKKDDAQVKYWERKADQGDLKLAGEEELRALRDKWNESGNLIDKRRLDLVEKEMKNRLTRAEKDRQSREKIAFGKIDATDDQKGIDRKESLRRWVIQNKVNRVKFAAGLMEKVKAKKMTSDQADAALADFDEVTSSADNTSPGVGGGM